MLGVCSTDGSGYWSAQKAAVAVTKIAITYIDEDTLVNSSFGELRAYFDPTLWRTSAVGLIYTDKSWIKQFQELLVTLGFSQDAALDVDYSEAGMQGKDFVSMDVRGIFLTECDCLVRFAKGAKPAPIEMDYE